ncbi:hypothetical protein D3C77_754160 [compost metagenome]
MYVVVAVAINPMRSVTALNAASNVRGSKWSERAMRLAMSPVAAATLSATNTASKHAASASCAR